MEITKNKSSLQLSFPVILEYLKKLFLYIFLLNPSVLYWAREIGVDVGYSLFV